MKRHNTGSIAKAVLFVVGFVTLLARSAETELGANMPRTMSGVFREDEIGLPAEDSVMRFPGARFGDEDSLAATGPLTSLAESVEDLETDPEPDGGFDRSSTRTAAALPGDVYDFVGDPNGESGIASEQPIWSGTYADTILRDEGDEGSVGAYSASQEASSSFDIGYIPEYRESPRLVDEAPDESRHVDSEGYSRLPRSWAVPPGGVVPVEGIDGESNYHRAYPYDDGYHYSSTYNGGAYTYPGSRYSLDAHHPEGPYGYATEVNDPFWSRENGGYPDDTGFTHEAGWPILGRGFNPEEAHLKVGPLYLQMVSAEAGVLYSDYNGPAFFRPGEEDGWLGYSSLQLRAAARLAPDIYFVLDGELIYLFGDNELGLRSMGNGSPFAALEYRGQWGLWDVRLYDELGTYGPFSRLGGDAYERAGRYSYGFLGYGGGRDSFLYDPLIYNRVGIEATRLVSPDWRVTAEADHTDYFYVDSDREDDHTAREHVGLLYSAEPLTMPFSPYVEYDGYLYRSDRLENELHTLYLGGSGRICERVTLDARIGHLWHTSDLGTSSDQFLWSVGFRHEIMEGTSHGIRFGQDYFSHAFSDDSLVSDYVRYFVDHEINERVSAYAYAQWSKDDYITGRLAGAAFDRSTFGARMSYRATERVTLDAGYRVDQTFHELAMAELNREVFDARISARLDRRTTAYLRYQHEDAEFFDENLYVAGIRRYF